MTEKGSFFSFIFQPNPRQRIWWKIFFILIFGLVLFFYNFPSYWNQGSAWLESQGAKVSWLKWLKIGKIPETKFHLGLDLQGGTRLIYEADLSDIPLSERNAAMAGVRDVIERRVNAFGVSEPVVKTVKSGDSHRLIVELPGIKNVNEAIKMIGETPVLEFKEEGEAKQRELTPEEKKEMEEYNKKASEKAQAILSEIQKNKGTNFEQLVQKYSEDEATKDKNGSLGFISRNSFYAKIWEWAKDHKIGEITTSPIETEEGLNIVKIVNQRETEKEVEASHILICYQGTPQCTSNLTKEQALEKIKALKAQVNPSNFEELAKENSTEPGAKQTGGYLGWFSKGMMVKPFEDTAFALPQGAISDVVETQFGFHLIYKKGERPLKEFEVERILIKTKKESDYLPPPENWQFTGLTGKQLKKAYLDFDPTTNAPRVGLEFNTEGKDLFAEITKRNVGKPLAIFLDGSPISIPRVNEPILEGKAVITGDFTVAEAKLLAQRLNAGALPVPIKLISQETISATLGEESIKKSLKAGIIGLLLVALYMILYYRLPGLLSAFALIFYALLALAIFKIIPVTLTLAGIAGFILSIGMAVDANVLIFSRLKEELELGKSISLAIKESFLRAWPSIRDGNITTLFSSLIFFWFSTSLVKGFGLTLSIGILSSMFTAIIITRAFFDLVLPWIKNEWWLGVKGKKKE